MEMEYIVSRGSQTFGPYNEAEVREYVSTGNIAPTDIVTGGNLEKPIPVRKALTFWSRTHTLQTGLRTDLPSPPDLPWWLAAILDLATGLTFFVAWDIVEAFWLRRVRPQSHALWYYLVAGLLFAINAPALYGNVLRGLGFTIHGDQTHEALLGVSAFVMRIVARFSMRRSLCEHYSQTEPIGLHLKWFWTLVFGGLYFQFHFNRINEAKRNLLNAPA